MLSSYRWSLGSANRSYCNTLGGLLSLAPLFPSPEFDGPALPFAPCPAGLTVSLSDGPELLAEVGDFAALSRALRGDLWLSSIEAAGSSSTATGS